MLLLYYTHSILFYFGLSDFKSKSDLTRELQSLDYEYLPQEVCVVQCMQQRKLATLTVQMDNDLSSTDTHNDTSLKICLDSCTTENATQAIEQHDIAAIKQIHENYILNLICRDDSSLNFRIDLHTTNKNEQFSTEQSIGGNVMETTANTSSSLDSLTVRNDTNGNGYGTLFVIKIHLANDADKFFVYLSDDNFFTIDKLMANKTYNISVIAVHSNNKYSVIAQQQQFRTLRRSYTPGNVTEIKITQFTQDKNSKMHLTATMTWKPAADMTCHYDIICFSPERQDYDLQPLEIRNPRQLFKYQLENLTFSSVYRVGIRASNTKNMRESELFWKTFAAPSCVEWYNYNFNICAPDAPQNLNIEQIYVDQHTYSLNISWLLPVHLPDNYTLRIQDLSEQGEMKVYNLKKETHNFYIQQITLHGMFYEVSLTANTRGGHSTTTYTDITKTVVHMPEKNPFVKLIAVILAPIFCVAILSLTIFIIYHRRAKLKRYQERCKYFEELEKKAPIDQKDDFDFAANIKQKPDGSQYQLDIDDMALFNDDMEIDRNNLTLYEVLGEGAFGLVKLGIYKDSKLGTTQEVAVKMLKDHPSADDIRAFRREIEVMKSVDKHPNIVGIIGHCTRLSNEMMLITEYCSFGNLLNFLRDEWHFLHEIHQNKQQSAGKYTAAFKFSKSVHQRQSIDNNKQITPVGLLAHDSNEFPQTRIDYPSGNKSNNINNDDDGDMNQVDQKDEQQYMAVIGSTPNIVSPATENKSYGYHGCCTSSCKCDVDVIIRNIDSSDSSKENEKLDHLLSRGMNSKQTQRCIDQGGRRVSTTIQIKNCNCKSKEQSRELFKDNIRKANCVVENKSYFKIFTADKHQPSKQQNLLYEHSKFKALEAKRKLKPQPAIPGVMEAAKNESVKADVLKRVPLSCGDLLNIARQVATGMDFLAMNKVVHRDLAARNVLVAPDRTIKIADFGLSRDVYQENIYKKTGNGKLPIKWLALESMTHQVYTTQSDVWSYGILLYEIITLGATPYPSIPTSRLLHLLKTGYRMEKPKNCDQEYYNLMYSCWNAVPNERPTFNEIVQKLTTMIDGLNVATDYTVPIMNGCTVNANNSSVINRVSSDDSYLKPL